MLPFIKSFSANVIFWRTIDQAASSSAPSLFVMPRSSLTTLSEIGIPKDMIPQLASQAINDVCTPGNPRDVTVEDIMNLYLEAY